MVSVLVLTNYVLLTTLLTPLLQPPLFPPLLLHISSSALLQQRVAGMIYCYDAWSKWFDKCCKQLQEEVEKQSKNRTQGQDKGGGKAGAGSKDTHDAKEKKEKLDEVGLLMWRVIGECVF